ncbi:hypothetical protein D6D15_03709 [Aureobasidium pullulans]|uniref:SnoRNA binding protein-like protein n=1 Tax=Aureobasidium pullulans TaxID=5580 RepID=A0A4S9BGU7_AURPU|nr:hypothetical protein D6D15_03709 [Aureobasidium pullulans]
MPEGSRTRAIFSLVRNLFLALILYISIYATIQLAQDPLAREKARQKVTLLADAGSVKQTTAGAVQIKVASTSRTVTLNPHANVFNRPSSAVVPRDDFFGTRPHVDTEADIQMIVEECRGSYDGLEKMRDVFGCLEFLSKKEERYYVLPEQVDRASEQNPRKAEYLDADGHGNTLKHYVSPGDAKPPSKSNTGTCSGPIIPYHVYWAGPATWRLEVFVKSYFYTQNIPCSRLWLWADTDRAPDAVERMLTKDPLFARFLPLVERGDIKVLPWKFPTRMPLPKEFDNTDGVGYYKTKGKPNARGEMAIADGLIEDHHGQQWVTLTPKQMTFFPQAISDTVRFIILHQHGGVYLDMDALMLRDLRPLLIPQKHAFAERWGAHNNPGEYNTAIMSLTANSSLSSYLLRGGVRMGLNFHPRVMGRMIWKEGRDLEFPMLETAAFDPIWTEFNWDREGRCTVPCLRDYSAVFKGKLNALKDEWESFDGPQLARLDFNTTSEQHQLQSAKFKRSVQPALDSEHVSVTPMSGPMDSFTTTNSETTALRNAGAILPYRIEQDKFPPNNRTLENFFRGAWTYHIHNQWLKEPEPNSWLHVLQSAHDGFFDGSRVNPYGEKWTGPGVQGYNLWSDMV